MRWVRQREDSNEILRIHGIVLDGEKVNIHLVRVNASNAHLRPRLPALLKAWARGRLNEAATGDGSKFQIR
eukprot:CAMPEP_0181255218 /NCGR_PEP_ID=MMETSP1096-20121128/49028_1 /TAXON_ID=156174 ORGANISM="Chrysochromulina ericina, Strain CCMP281" /NCGR_SAMPLE_ID=MMETSP1096 /ASSEMBLY_ACC=CAM_ASM_000453 /LENGTH=70 /DNA_ID=CAMNT_0023353323 /DNA_START=494 /DNA_END=703 /DNA_ORIENTATION=+